MPSEEMVDYMLRAALWAIALGSLPTIYFVTMVRRHGFGHFRHQYTTLSVIWPCAVLFGGGIALLAVAGLLLMMQSTTSVGG